MKPWHPALKAAALTLVFGASSHLLLLLWYAVVHRNYEIMNVWNILDLDFLMPGIEKGPVNFVLSYLSLAVVYIGIYLARKKRG